MNRQWQTSPFAELKVDDLYDLLRLRQLVFVVEQDCIYLDLDGLDSAATHMLCREDGRLLAYQRCLPPGVGYPQSSIGRIVVAPEARGLGLGRDLVQRGVEYNLARWPDSGIRLNAQAYLRRFYTELGFVAHGDEYDEDGIPHVQMLYATPAER